MEGLIDNLHDDDALLNACLCGAVSSVCVCVNAVVLFVKYYNSILGMDFVSMISRYLRI